MAKLTEEQIIEAIESMSVLELSKLTKALEEKFGVSASAMTMMSAAPAAGAPTAAAEEKSSFNVVLAGSGAQKLAVIKALRTITDLGLKEAKDLVEASDASPKPVKEGVSKEEADKMKAVLEEAGAKVVLE